MELIFCFLIAAMVTKTTVRDVAAAVTGQPIPSVERWKDRQRGKAAPRKEPGYFGKVLGNTLESWADSSTRRHNRKMALRAKQAPQKDAAWLAKQERNAEKAAARREKFATTCGVAWGKARTLAQPRERNEALDDLDYGDVPEAPEHPTGEDSTEPSDLADVVPLPRRRPEVVTHDAETPSDEDALGEQDSAEPFIPRTKLVAELTDPRTPCGWEGGLRRTTPPCQNRRAPGLPHCAAHMPESDALLREAGQPTWAELIEEINVPVPVPDLDYGDVPEAPEHPAGEAEEGAMTANAAWHSLHNGLTKDQRDIAYRWLGARTNSSGAEAMTDSDWFSLPAHVRACLLQSTARHGGWITTPMTDGRLMPISEWDPEALRILEGWGFSAPLVDQPLGSGDPTEKPALTDNPTSTDTNTAQEAPVTSPAANADITNLSEAITYTGGMATYAGQINTRVEQHQADLRQLVQGIEAEYAAAEQAIASLAAHGIKGPEVAQMQTANEQFSQLLNSFQAAVKALDTVPDAATSANGGYTQAKTAFEQQTGIGEHAQAAAATNSLASDTAFYTNA